MELREEPDVANASPSPDTPVSAAEANERYRFATKYTAEQLDELHALLSLDVDVMNVLCLAYMDLGTDMLNDRTDPVAVDHARQRGWITPGRPQLTQEGLYAWWDWKSLITPHLRDERFQQIWRDVVAW